jgi:Domain of unknown function (DUF4260)
VPRLGLRLEGLFVGVAAVTIYFADGHRWWLFVALILAPDLSAVGYLRGPHVGALAYDLGHLYAWPVVLGLVGVLGDVRLATELALIWAAHIGIDRALGYGLKYPSGFKDTHLQRV